MERSRRTTGRDDCWGQHRRRCRRTQNLPVHRELQRGHHGLLEGPPVRAGSRAPPRHALEVRDLARPVQLRRGDVGSSQGGQADPGRASAVGDARGGAGTGHGVPLGRDGRVPGPRRVGGGRGRCRAGTVWYTRYREKETWFVLLFPFFSVLFFFAIVPGTGYIVADFAFGRYSTR